MFVGELKGLHQTQRLVDRATDRQVVNGYLPQDAFFVDDEEASEKEQIKSELYRMYTYTFLLPIRYGNF